MANFLVTLFLGFLGVHRFMQKKYVTGFIWFFTIGLCGVGWFVDVCIAFSNMVKDGGKEGDKAEPTGDGEKKGFWAEMKEKTIKNRQEAAIRAAYKKEEEKRKPTIKKIRHTRPLTPQEQQTIDMIEMEMTRLRVDRESGKITNSAEFRAWNSLWNQKENIKRRAEWYETIELPPEVDPDTPIYVDEEAIRNSITGLF